MHAVSKWGGLLAVATVVACMGPPGEPGPAGPAGPQGASAPEVLEWTLTAIDFGEAGATRVPLTLTNRSPSAISGLSIAASQGFSVSTSCSSTLAAGAACGASVSLSSGSTLPATGTLTASAGSKTATAALARPLASCKDIKAARPSLPDGTYLIDPDGSAGAQPIQVQCDMTTDGGGWTLVASVVEDDGVYSWTQFANGPANIANWTNRWTFGSLEAFQVSDYKSPAFVTLAANDLMVMDETGNWGRFNQVLQGKSLRERISGVTTCATAPLLAPGSPQIASSDPVAAANMFFGFMGGDPNDTNRCPLNYAPDATDAAVIFMGGNSSSSVGVGYVGYFTGSIHTDHDTNFCLRMNPIVNGTWYSTPDLSLQGPCTANYLYVR